MILLPPVILSKSYLHDIVWISDWALSEIQRLGYWLRWRQWNNLLLFRIF